MMRRTILRDRLKSGLSGILAFVLISACGASLSAASLRSLYDSPDNRIAIRISYGLRSLRSLDDRHLELTIGMSVSAASRLPEAYRIESEDDPNYAYRKFIRPLSVDVRTETEADAPPGCAFRKFEREIVRLAAPYPMKRGKSYSVIALGAEGSVVTGGHAAQTIKYPSPDAGRDPRIDLAALGLRRIEIVGPRLLMLEFGPNFSPIGGGDPANYRIAIDRKPVAVRHLGRITRVDAYVTEGWPFKPIPMHEIYLEGDRNFRDGDLIEANANESVTRANSAVSLRFDSSVSLTNSIQANQIGYLTDSPAKVAYLGRWMGSFPEDRPGANPSLAYAQPPSFTLCDARTKRVVFVGKAKLIHRSGERDEGDMRVDYSGENVRLLDFSRFKRPGRYFIRVEGTGRSLSFAIGPDAYETAFKISERGLFEQRCGIELAPPYSDWRRIACHKKGIVPTTQNRYEPLDIRDLAKKVDESRIETGDQAREKASILRAFGGHHDAGDYNPRSHLDIAQTLMDAYEMTPKKFYDGQLNLPESGNGIPDILDEAFWALRIWIGLQDADGGVYDGTESNGDPNFYQTVELDPLGDYAYAKDGAGSLNYAGAMAQASRIWKSLGRAREASDFLRRSRSAYRWAVRHPPAAGHPESTPYRDAWAYAAAELLHTTGEETYQEDFARACVWSRNPDAAPEEYQSYDQSRAAWAYSRCPLNRADAKLRKAITRSILSYADSYISASSTMAYAFLRHPGTPVSWGTGALLHWAIPVSRAYSLSGDPKYRLWIVRSCDNALGANPINRSYIVGLGTRTVRAPLHNSRYNPSGEVASGMQAEGPNERGEGYGVSETAYPPIREGFAPLQDFVDAHFAISMDEGLSENQAEAVAIFGGLLPDANEPQNAKLEKKRSSHATGENGDGHLHPRR